MFTELLLVTFSYADHVNLMRYLSSLDSSKESKFNHDLRLTHFITDLEIP